jgi:long-chain acyl-CoA synthetase
MPRWRAFTAARAARLSSWSTRTALELRDVRLASALGAALVSRYGIAAGDRVAIAMRNYPEWVVAFAAITSIGAISVSLNAWWTSEELDYALRDSGSRLVIADAERVARIAPLLATLDLGVIAVRAPRCPRTSSAGRRWSSRRAAPGCRGDPDMDATILYISAPPVT